MTRPQRAKRVIGFSPRRSDRCAIRSMSRSSARQGFSGDGSNRLLSFEGAVVFPDGPDDASELVGERDGGLVVAAGLFELEGPSSEAIGMGRFLGVPEDGASAVDEEHAKVGVAALGDAAEVTGETARVFARGEAEVAGEVAAGRKATNIADEGDEGGGGKSPIPGMVFRDETTGSSLARASSSFSRELMRRSRSWISAIASVRAGRRARGSGVGDRRSKLARWGGHERRPEG